MQTEKSLPDPESWPKPVTKYGAWSVEQMNIWVSLFDDYKLHKHFKAALNGNRTSIARMEKFADAVATAKLRGEL